MNRRVFGMAALGIGTAAQSALSQVPSGSFVAHCHFERNHQGLENRLIIPDKNLARNNGAIRRHGGWAGC